MNSYSYILYVVYLMNLKNKNLVYGNILFVLYMNSVNYRGIYYFYFLY